MSNAWLTYVFDHSPSRGGVRLVLLALADRADDSGRSFPSVADTAHRAWLSERRTRACLRQLVRTGELKICKRGGGVLPDGTGRTNVYQLVGQNPARSAAETLSPASGFTGSETRKDRPGTLSPTAANPEVSSPEPCRRQQGNPAEPTVNPQKNQEAREARLNGAVAAAADRRAAEVADPEAAKFNKFVLERQADSARVCGGLTPSPIASSATTEYRRLGIRPPSHNGHRPKRGRIPESEQQRTCELLRQVNGLTEVDARDLARIGSTADFQQAIAELARKNGSVRNVGGWLRQCIKERWLDRGEATA